MAQLGVQLVNYLKYGFMVHQCSESFLVANVKSKEHVHPILMEFIESVLGMKKDILGFVAKCPNCQQVEVEHLKQGVCPNKYK